MRLPVILFSVEFDLCPQVRVEGDVLDCRVSLAMADTDPCDNLILRHLEATLELLARARAERPRIHSVFEVQLNGAYRIVNAARDPVQEPLGQLKSLPLGHALIQVSRVAELKLASFFPAKRQLAKCATLIKVLTLSAVMTGRLYRCPVPILRVTHRSQTLVLYV